MATGRNYRLPGVKVDPSTGSFGAGSRVVFAIFCIRLFFSVSPPLSFFFFVQSGKRALIDRSSTPAAALVLGIIT